MFLTRFDSLILLSALLLGSGCALAPNRVKYPDLSMKGTEPERRSAQVQDPFPDSKIGPGVNFRPLGYQQQRAEPIQSKDRYYSSFLKSHFGGPQAPQQIYQPGIDANATAQAVPMMGSPMPGQRVAMPVNHGQQILAQQPMPGTIASNQMGVMPSAMSPMLSPTMSPSTPVVMNIGVPPQDVTQAGFQSVGATPYQGIPRTVVVPGALHPGLMQNPPMILPPSTMPPAGAIGYQPIPMGNAPAYAAPIHGAVLQ